MTPKDRELVFNDAGRLFQLIESGVLKAEYVYNDEGQRTRKVVYQADGIAIESITIFHHDAMGYLISETDEAGALIRDYIWTENMHPVAQIDDLLGTEVVSYLYTDHLMTNRLATDEFQQVIWRWEGEAFGNTEAEELAGVSVNLRFPGQYFDTETNLNYNWNRYYDPELGRYITSDPLGLAAGGNTYSYVRDNPLSFSDRSGRKIKCEERTRYYERLGRKLIQPEKGYEKRECYPISEPSGNMPDPFDTRGPKSTRINRGLRNVPLAPAVQNVECPRRYIMTQEAIWKDVPETWVQRWLDCVDTCTGRKFPLWMGPDEPVGE